MHLSRDAPLYWSWKKILLTWVANANPFEAALKQAWQKIMVYIEFLWLSASWLIKNNEWESFKSYKKIRVPLLYKNQMIIFES